MLDALTVATDTLAGQTITFAPHEPDPLVICGEGGKPLVTVKRDGSLEYGEGYRPDEAARIFWRAMAFHFPGRRGC